MLSLNEPIVRGRNETTQVVSFSINETTFLGWFLINENSFQYETTLFDNETSFTYNETIVKKSA